MGLLPTSLWGWWSLGIIVIGLLFLAWLSVSIYKSDATTVRSPDDVWDENLREGNTTPPAWWFFALFATLIFSCAYIILYPGLGDNTGLLKWSQHTQLARGTKHYEEKTAATHEKWRQASLDALREDGSAMNSARRLYMSECAACHGADARGQAGLFPNLADDEWTWGNSDEQLLRTLNDGRVAAMPAWRGVLSEAQIQAVTDYVLALAGGDTAGAAAAHADGQKVYTANCVACHGVNGEGNQALGSPRLVNHTWQYLRDGEKLRDAVLASVRDGRQGVMPAQKNRLHPEQIRILAAWVGTIANGDSAINSLNEYVSPR